MDRWWITIFKDGTPDGVFSYPSFAHGYATRQGQDVVEVVRAAPHDKQTDKAQGAKDTLEQVRLYGEKMIRDADANVRPFGADLLAIINTDDNTDDKE